jgi:hypothetical protein
VPEDRGRLALRPVKPDQRRGLEGVGEKGLVSANKTGHRDSGLSQKMIRLIAQAHLFPKEGCFT